MNNEQHTPGPWFWYDDGYGAEVEPPEPGKRWLTIYQGDEYRGVEVAVIVNRTGEPTPTQEANARLIAAAPDLLAAAREVVGYWSAGVHGAEVPDDVRRLRAAIAKAEGHE